MQTIYDYWKAQSILLRLPLELASNIQQLPMQFPSQNSIHSAFWLMFGETRLTLVIDTFLVFYKKCATYKFSMSIPLTMHDKK